MLIYYTNYLHIIIIHYFFTYQIIFTIQFKQFSTFHIYLYFLATFYSQICNLNFKLTKVICCLKLYTSVYTLKFSKELFILNLVKEIKKLKEEKGALILAHLYQPAEIQEIADLVGDSYFLSKKAVESSSNLIVFCGVRFMAESAKILSPNKKVLLPASESTCPMADMGIPERLATLKKEHPNAKVISYINTNLDIKSMSDICVTSSSALKIMNNIKEEEIIFLPDRDVYKRQMYSLL